MNLRKEVYRYKRRNTYQFFSFNSKYLPFSICTVTAPAMSGSSVASGNRSGSILLNFDSEEHQGPSRMQQQQQKLGETESSSL